MWNVKNQPSLLYCLTLGIIGAVSSMLAVVALCKVDPEFKVFLLQVISNM